MDKLDWVSGTIVSRDNGSPRWVGRGAGQVDIVTYSVTLLMDEEFLPRFGRGNHRFDFFGSAFRDLLNAFPDGTSVRLGLNEIGVPIQVARLEGASA